MKVSVNGTVPAAALINSLAQRHAVEAAAVRAQLCAREPAVNEMNPDRFVLQLLPDGRESRIRYRFGQLSIFHHACTVQIFQRHITVIRSDEGCHFVNRVGPASGNLSVEFSQNRFGLLPVL